MPRGVLVIKLGALGDVVMATALLERIVAHHAGERVVLLTTPAYRDVFEGRRGLEVQAFPRRGLAAGIAVLRWIRRQRFSRVYDLQSNDRSGLWCALSGIPERVGNHPRFPYNLHPPSRWRGQKHIFERMNEVLAAAGVAPAPARPVLPADARRRAHVSHWLAAHDLAERTFALLHAGASPRRLAAKRWPHYAALAPALAARGVTPVWIGAGADAAINRALAALAGVDATDAFDVAALAELGRHARFALTNDSGPMHVLAASGIPVYAFFGPTDWRRNHALGQRRHVLAAPVLGSITPEAVLERLARDGLLG